MTDESNAYAVVIADLKRQRDEIDRTIAKLEAMAAGRPLPVTGNESAPDGNAKPSDKEHKTGPAGNSPYLGMSIVAATKALLESRRATLSPTEIVQAIEDGGLYLSGTNKANTIGSVLNRRQKKEGDIVSVKRGQWGLREWYPGRNFGKKSEGSNPESDRDETTEPSEPEPPYERPQIVPLRSSE